MIDLTQILEMTLNGNGDSDKHIMTLFSIAVGGNSKNIIELGVRGGNTTLPLILASKLTGGKVTSVDINETEFKCPKELQDNWNFVKSDAIEFLLKLTPSDNIDLIYIDDWHSYDHVKQELDILDKIISPSTIILLHDLMYGNTNPFYHTDLTLKDGQWANGGPYRAVAELNPQFWEFATLPWNNGLTILRKKYSNKYKQK